MGRQGIVLQGHKGEDNFTQLTVLLGAKDGNIGDESLGNKYTSHDIHNELLEIMTNHVLLEKIEEMEKMCFFLQWATSILTSVTKSNFHFAWKFNMIF